MKSVRAHVVTASDGSATVYTANTKGKLHSVAYLKTDFADGVDFAITVEDTGEGVWTESNVNAATVRKPRAPVHSQVGVALNYADTFPIGDKVGLASDRFKIVIAQGGNVKSGDFVFLLED